MPRVTYDTDYSVTLSTEGDYLRVGFNRERNQITAFRVQYEATIAGKIRPVVRCDCAHGFPHCDILDYHGRNVDKIHLPRNRSLKDIFDQIVSELKATWPRQRAAFMERLP